MRDLPRGGDSLLAPCGLLVENRRRQEHHDGGKTTQGRRRPKSAERESGRSDRSRPAVELVRPQQALVLQLQRDPWQALAAACLTPAFYNGDYAVPLVLDDGSEKREVAIAHDTASVSGFGDNAAAATAKIAKTYWKKAPCVFVVETYEQALWIVPSAAIVSAPILVQPDEATLAALGAKTAVVVGEGKPASRARRSTWPAKRTCGSSSCRCWPSGGRSATTW